MKVEQLYGPKVKSFQLLELEYLLQEDAPELFFTFGLKKGGQIIVTHAPARLDIMGGVADYCGANVFEMTLDRIAIARLSSQRRQKSLCNHAPSRDPNSSPTFISRLIVYTPMAPSKPIQRFKDISTKNRALHGRATYSGRFMCFSKNGKLTSCHTEPQ